MGHNDIEAHTVDYTQRLLKDLADKKQAMVYLEVALLEYEEDQDANAFMLALKNVVQAQGGVGELSKKTGLDRAHLYRVFSKQGNPRFLTLDNILKALGFRLSIGLV